MSARNGKGESAWVVLKVNCKEQWRRGKIEEKPRKDRLSNWEKPPQQGSQGPACYLSLLPSRYPSNIRKFTPFPFSHWLSRSSELLLNIYLIKTQAEYRNILMAN